MTHGVVLERLAPNDALLVAEAVKAKFVDESPRVWSLGLKKPYIYYDADSTSLSKVLPVHHGRVLFIPETDDKNPLPVYRIEASDIENLIGNCPFFEYYVVDSRNEWLIAETEHSIFIFCYASGSEVRVLPLGRIWPEE